MMEVCRLEKRLLRIVSLIVCLLYQRLNFGFSLNDEGYSLLRFRDRVVNDPFGALSNWNEDLGVTDPCTWYGVECSEGKVVVLNLRSLCLEGTISSDLGYLAHLKSIILRNNSFSGTIPEKIGQLKELEVLDLGYNNFSGTLPSDLGNNLSLTILLIDNNELLGSISPEIRHFALISEAQVDVNQLSNHEQKLCPNRGVMPWNIAKTGGRSQRQLLADENIQVLTPQFTISQTSPSPSPSPTPSPSSSPSPSPSSNAPGTSPSSSPAPSAVPNQNPSPNPSTNSEAPASLAVPSLIQRKSSVLKRHRALFVSLIIGSSVFVGVLALFVWRCNKVATVRPWTTGLSGQLQKAFVTGVPKLKRSELEAACEDFSNVIGSTATGTIYKGTLSSGVEIAVASVAENSAKDWSKHLESQFRKRIDMLSKVNHKNFVNLLGYCVEEVPFTRMIVFEYAPNGTLFEHLHVQEAEHLDWAMRMRIAMGMAYCLNYMHQLTPPIAHKNLHTSSVNLTEDYAAKISTFNLCNDSTSSANTALTPESNVYSFGVILFEMMTGRIPFAVGDAIDDWASDFLKGQNPISLIVDPTLKSFDMDGLDSIGKIISSCVHPDPKMRPKMREITAKLKEITRISPDGAIPKISPLWWAELEILSTEAT